MDPSGLAVPLGTTSPRDHLASASDLRLLTGATLFLSGLSPFGFKPRANDLKAAFEGQSVPFGRPATEPLRSTKPFYWAAELLTWTLAGALFALAARESRVRGARPIGWAIGASVLLSLAIEASQLAIPAATSTPLRSCSPCSGRLLAPPW